MFRDFEVYLFDPENFDKIYPKKNPFVFSRFVNS